MNIDKILKNRETKIGRSNRPLNAFVELYDATNNAINEVRSLGVSIETQETMVKSHVINIVSAVEVYYRDTLDLVLKTCDPNSFKNKLKKLHDKSYKIDDLITFYENRVHPLELISINQNFQNVSVIDKVFTIVIDDSFFKKCKGLCWRLKDEVDTESKITHLDIKALQDLFDYRHVLIHSPSASMTHSMDIVEDWIDSVLGVIIASDIVILNHINENFDPMLKSELN